MDILIFGILFIIISIFVIVFSYNDEFDIWILLTGVCVLIIGVALCSGYFYKGGYKKGQINALSKKSIDYKLITFKNGTCKWRKIKEKKE